MIPQVAHPEEVHNGPAEVQAIDDHSGTAMFAQLGILMENKIKPTLFHK